MSLKEFNKDFTQFFMELNNLKLISSNTPLSEASIAHFEALYGMKIPPQLLKLYKQSNGGSLNVSEHPGIPGVSDGELLGLHEFFPLISQDINEITIEEFLIDNQDPDSDIVIPEDLIPFGRFNSSYWFIGHRGQRNGQIFYLEELGWEDEPYHFAHNSLAEFLSSFTLDMKLEGSLLNLEFGEST